MNCYLDGDECVVVQRSNRRYHARQSETHGSVPPSRDPDISGVSTAGLTAEQLMRSRVAELASFVMAEKSKDAPDDDDQMGSHTEDTSANSLNCKNTTDAALPGVLPTARAKEDEDRFGISFQDMTFIKQQGCLHVPARYLMEEFLEKYFLRIHPFLPIINEKDTWGLWSMTGPLGELQMPLLLLRSILFASCNFVSVETIQALGYRSIREARASFYRHAKLLHDFETESSPIVMAQASLLLSFWSPESTKKSNTSWLGLAIQHARNARAHRYASMGRMRSSAHQTQHHEQNVLKRITRAHFDFDTSPSLEPSDLADEFEQSKVCASQTKRHLAGVFSHFTRLCVVLTDILVVAFPLNDSPEGWQRPRPADAQLLRDTKTHLQKWFADAASTFPSFGRSGLSDLRARDDSHSCDLVFVYTNLMYMFYHSARVVLCNSEILAHTLSQSRAGWDSKAAFHESRYELQNAASGVAECVRDMVQEDLARWLPISAIGLTALPLVLNILDVNMAELATSSTTQFDAVLSLKQHRLNVLIEAMKVYRLHLTST
ncbi:Cutinase transcription factor 1 beta-like protein [Emericellopsis cladophorae]|uniref:Cutinase transcription factor 1 beta-like protein n=1 Tax=Emericellopsis cladophorae TaxID=2686198 RepID=A0A9P9Y6N6_9HYPO|nr:Cutinase transcription factor 1 beta-like protein [Emericellopsis cladophorae]KAI6783914.1 Cutinase transcription factor 1 beta-like protein [Emericellopsis cladophorae]